MGKLVQLGQLDENDDEHNTIRGLEHKTKNGMKMKKRNRTQAYSSVFMEINHQKEEAGFIFEDEAVAYEYFIFSNRCSVSAQMIAKRDEIDVFKMWGKNEVQMISAS